MEQIPYWPKSQPLTESQRLLDQHRLRWKEEAIKQRIHEAKRERDHEETQEHINRYPHLGVRHAGQIQLEKNKRVARMYAHRAQAVEMQREMKPNEEDSYDRLDPEKLPGRHRNWHWEPKGKGEPYPPVRLPPGKRYSAQDMVPFLQQPYRPEYYRWIQEVVRMGKELGETMRDHRIKNEYTAYDIGNDQWRVM